MVTAAGDTPYAACRSDHWSGKPGRTRWEIARGGRFSRVCTSAPLGGVLRCGSAQSTSSSASGSWGGPGSRYGRVVSTSVRHTYLAFAHPAGCADPSRVCPREQGVPSGPDQWSSPGTRRTRAAGATAGPQSRGQGESRPPFCCCVLVFLPGACRSSDTPGESRDLRAVAAPGCSKAEDDRGGSYARHVAVCAHWARGRRARSVSLGSRPGPRGRGPWPCGGRGGA